MLTKVYLSTWLVIAAAFAVFFLTGNMTMFVLVVFGFIAFGMVFMGMMGVLPTIVGPHATPARSKKTEEGSSTPVKTAIPHGAHTLRA